MPDFAVPNERLWVEMPGEVARPHRVVPCGPVHLAEVNGRRQRAIQVRAIGSADLSIAPAAELTDATPLSQDEVAEYRRLDRALAGSRIPEARNLRAFNALLHRWEIYGLRPGVDGELGA